jgi:hypothetical protein
MQSFVCPQCGHRNSFDPWVGAARCSRCGFTPPTDGTAGHYVRWARRYAYQPYLDELLSHWHGTHQPDPGFTFETPDDALAFFHGYQRALGEDPRGAPGPHVDYTREYQPIRQEILTFAGAYLLLRRGQGDQAARDLGALTLTTPAFVDAWVWLSATSGDPTRRREYLEQATRRDAGHPLARDALAVVDGRIAWDDGPPREEVAVAQCSQCGAGLRYEPGAGQVECPHCGFCLDLRPTDLVDGQATPVHNLRLKRRYEGHTWREARRVVHCNTCGAEMTMTGHLARCCAFCGSTNVLVQDSGRDLQQPDGLAPFQVGPEQARQAIDQALDAFSRRLTSWLTGRRQRLAGLQGIYLPFWVFDGLVEEYDFEKSWSTTSKRTLGLSSQENLLFPGVRPPSPQAQRAVLPFRLEGLVPYEPRLLADWPSRLYSVDVEMVAEGARSTILGRARAANRLLGTPIQGASQIYYQVLGMSYQLVLLPLWLGRLEDGLGSLPGSLRPGLALVNGQTGRLHIAAPGAGEQGGLDGPPA